MFNNLCTIGLDVMKPVQYTHLGTHQEHCGLGDISQHDKTNNLPSFIVEHLPRLIITSY
jgi:hypothetical protein